MPLLIENVTELPRPDDRPHDYILRVNRRPLAKFQAVRSLGYAACLRAAADALDKAPIYTHPAAPSADKLRIAVEAAFIAGATSVHEHWTENPGEAPNGDPEFDEAANDYALAALKAEGAK